MELLDFREALEPPIAARAAERATSVNSRRLHRLTEEQQIESGPGRRPGRPVPSPGLALATRNHVLVKLVETSIEEMNQTRTPQPADARAAGDLTEGTSRDPGRDQGGDADTAGLAMTNHIRGVAALVIQTTPDAGVSKRRERTMTEEVLDLYAAAPGRPLSRAPSFAGGPPSD